MFLCDETITVFNAYIDPATRYDAYSSTVIKGVSWFGEVVSQVTDKGLTSANKYRIRIPVNYGDDESSVIATQDYDGILSKDGYIIASSGSVYVDPTEFKRLSNKSGYWTLQQGDTIVRGEVADEHREASPSILEKNYKEVVTVIDVADDIRNRRASHWKVVAK